jgi:fatty acid desaturase
LGVIASVVRSNSRESGSMELNEDASNLRRSCAQDIADAQAFLRKAGLATIGRKLLEKSLVTYVSLAVVDWTLIVASVYCAFAIHPALALLAIPVVGNRQRALGNLLHDFAHGGFGRRTKLADGLGTLLLTLPMFSTFKAYRKDHFAHHLFSGSPEFDPDYIIDANIPFKSKLSVFLRYIFDWRIWLGSVRGMWSRETSWGRVQIVIWWVCGLGLLAALVSPEFSAFFAAVWMVSRVTSFHVITTFREMADHVGMKPGALISYTRNSPMTGFWRPIIHPHNNGMHTVHHLFPRAPFYALPTFHQLLMAWPKYVQSEHCIGYFSSPTDEDSQTRLYVFDSFTSAYVHSEPRISASSQEIAK